MRFRLTLCLTILFISSVFIGACGVVYAAEMLPAHEPIAFALPAIPTDPTPGALLFWMISTLIGFTYAFVSEILPFIKCFKFDGVADFFVQGFRALKVDQSPDTMRNEMDLLKQAVDALEISYSNRTKLPDPPSPAAQPVVVEQAPAPPVIPVPIISADQVAVAQAPVTVPVPPVAAAQAVDNA